MDNEELNHITYNRFSNPKKYRIQHRNIDSDSAVLNSIKQSKNSPGFAMAPPPTTTYDKREDSLNYKSSSMDDYQQAYQKQKYYKQNQELKYQLQKHQEDIQKSIQYCQQQQQLNHQRREMDNLKIEKTKSETVLNKPSELSSSIRKMVPRDPRGEYNSRNDITGSMGNLSLNDRKLDSNLSPNFGSKNLHKHRKMKSSGDMHIYEKPKKSHKRIDSADKYNSDDETYSDNDRRDLMAREGSNSGKKSNRINKQQYQSPSMSQTSINSSSSTPVPQNNQSFNKYNEEGLDVSVGEILVHGLKAMLKSKVPLCYFLHTLIEDYCCENLFFYLEIEQYKIFMFENAKAQLKAAQYIYITYLDASSKIEVNIDEKIRRDILNQLNSKTCNLTTVFDKAREAVFALMESSYAKFNRSDIKRQMIDELDNTNVYGEEYKINAIRLLTSYLDKRKRELEADEEIMNMNAENNNQGERKMSISPEQMLHFSNVQRNRLIYALTHEFIRAFLELDFDDESVPGEVCVFRPPIQYIQNINEDPYKHLSTSPNSQRILQDVQISINTDSQGQQYQMITTPPIPIASFRLDNYGSLNSGVSRSSGGKNNPNPFKKFMKSVKLMS
ncbi:hypothetical protein BCR36DRAFT_4132 [Piromyces finnis]|uniref:RGS domain-containing protein n=1 Tax=Piromyces finnis TaxID=1754191 RepID=A0A1Y1VNG8_9FUNG|nr:hypothetical protein BCR36DRAFT_4132 [Piromyces finnis]|eukprot:ORX60957.1 hypothetical protein BCR36DRAFT_4132 [Piromyces finnis]